MYIIITIFFITANSKKNNYEREVFPLFEKYSCIKFVPKDKNPKSKFGLSHSNYLLFNNNVQ